MKCEKHRPDEEGIATLQSRGETGLNGCFCEKHRPDEEGIETLQLSSPLPGGIYVGNRDLMNKGL